MKEAATAITQNLNCFGNLNWAQLSFSLKDGITPQFKAISNDFRMKELSREKHYRIHSHCWSQVCSKCNTLWKKKKSWFKAMQCCHRIFPCPSPCDGNLTWLWSCDRYFSLWWLTRACDIWFTDVLSTHSITSSIFILKYSNTECLTAIIRDFVKKSLGTGDGKV